MSHVMTTGGAAGTSQLLKYLKFNALSTRLCVMRLTSHELLVAGSAPSQILDTNINELYLCGARSSQLRTIVTASQPTCIFCARAMKLMPFRVARRHLTLAARDVKYTATVLSPMYVHLSPLHGCLAYGSRALAQQWEAGNPLACAPFHRHTSDESLQPTRNRSLPAPHLGPALQGRFLGLALRLPPTEVRGALIDLGIAPLARKTKVSIARFERLVELLIFALPPDSLTVPMRGPHPTPRGFAADADAMRAAPSLCGLSIYLAYVWASARSKYCLLAFLLALQAELSPRRILAPSADPACAAWAQAWVEAVFEMDVNYLLGGGSVCVPPPEAELAWLLALGGCDAKCPLGVGAEGDDDSVGSIRGGEGGGVGCGADAGGGVAGVVVGRGGVGGGLGGVQLEATALERLAYTLSTRHGRAPEVRQEHHGYRGQPAIADCVEACACELIGLALWNGIGAFDAAALPPAADPRVVAFFGGSSGGSGGGSGGDDAREGAAGGGGGEAATGTTAASAAWYDIMSARPGLHYMLGRHDEEGEYELFPSVTNMVDLLGSLLGVAVETPPVVEAHEAGGGSVGVAASVPMAPVWPGAPIEWRLEGTSRHPVLHVRWAQRGASERGGGGAVVEAVAAKAEEGRGGRVDARGAAGEVPREMEEIRIVFNGARHCYSVRNALATEPAWVVDVRRAWRARWRVRGELPRKARTAGARLLGGVEGMCRVSEHLQ